MTKKVKTYVPLVVITSREMLTELHMGLFGKMAGLGAGLKDSVTSATGKVLVAAGEAELGSKLSGLKDIVVECGTDYVAAGKDRASELVAMASQKLSEVDVEALKRPETYANKFNEYRDLGADKVSNYLKSTFEVDKTTAEMVEAVRDRLPSRPQDLDHIFEQCKREAFRRAISAFCLAPIVTGFESRRPDQESQRIKQTGHSREWPFCFLR